ncbi:hypothetical protein M2436_001072 [Streptomyces sp. HB372]|nr:hypothetical protein [Streptomyces sp. HB372]
MDAGVDVGGEEDVAGDDRLLGDGRPPAEPEFGGDDALVHLGALGEAGLLGVLGDDAVEGLHVLQGAAHDHRVVDALAVVGEDLHPGGGVVHRAELGELLALQADGDGAHGLHVAVAGLLAEPPDLLDDAGGVGDGEGVGHGVHGGEAADGRGPGAGEDGLGVLAAGLAQMGVQVDQAGQQDLPLGLDHGGAGGVEAGADLGDGLAVDQDVPRLAAEDPRTADKDLAHGYLFSSVRAGAADSAVSEPPSSR